LASLSSAAAASARCASFAHHGSSRSTSSRLVAADIAPPGLLLILSIGRGNFSAIIAPCRDEARHGHARARAQPDGPAIHAHRRKPRLMVSPRQRQLAGAPVG
jgi:hypothetical protein